MLAAHPDGAPSLQLGRNEISVAQAEGVSRKSARDEQRHAQKEAEAMARLEKQEQGHRWKQNVIFAGLGMMKSIACLRRMRN